MTIVRIKEARIPRGHPTFGIFRFGRTFRAFIIFDKGPRRSIEHLSTLRDFHFNIRRGHPNRIRINLPIRLDSYKNRRFRLPIKLLQIDPHRAEEIKYFRPDSLACGISNAHPAKPKRVFKWAVNDRITNQIGQAIQSRNRVAIQNILTHPAGVRHEISVQALLDAACILHPQHHRREHAFKNPRRRKIIARSDFTQIRQNRFLAFRAIYAQGRIIRLPDRENEIAHPRDRQIRQQAIGFLQPIKFAGILCRNDDISVA